MNTNIFYDTVKLFEQALNKKIILNISRTAETGSVSISTNSVSKLIQNPYKLTIPYEGVGLASNQQDSYAILQHEVSHIIFGSTSKVVIDFFEEKKHKKFKEVSNILEDQRIEDCLGKLYVGAYQDLQVIKPKLCQDDPCKVCKSGQQMPTIAHMLFGIRSGISKPCSNQNERCKVAHQANDMVLGGKSIKATFVAMKLLESYIDEEDGNQQGGKGNTVSDPNGKMVLINSPLISDPNGNQTQPVTNPNNPTQPKPDPNTSQTPPMYANFKSNIEDDMNIDSKDLTKMDQTMEELLEDSVQEFLGQLEEVQKSLNNNQPKKEKVFGKIVSDKAIFKEDRRDYKPDPRMKQLRKYFKDLKYKEQQKGLDDGGELLDIDGLISNKVYHNGEVFQSIENVHGLEVTYLVDLSGSMKSGGSLQIAKQSLVDMVELSKGLFDIKVFGFSGSSSEPTVSLVQQIPLNKIVEMDTNIDYTYTHTHHGVQIASQKFTGVSTKRVLIIITDGMPCSCKYDDKIMDAFAKKAVENARKLGVRVYTIISGDINGNDERISNIFGRESNICKIKNVNEIYRVMKEETIKNLICTIRGG